MVITLLSTNFQATILPACSLGSLFLMDPMVCGTEIHILRLDELSPDPEAAQSNAPGAAWPPVAKHPPLWHCKPGLVQQHSTL